MKWPLAARPSFPSIYLHGTNTNKIAIRPHAAFKKSMLEGNLRIFLVLILINPNKNWKL